jgi:hypothetical protein
MSERRESGNASESLHQLLRNSVPGYVLVFLVLLPYFLTGTPLQYGDTTIAALLIVGGPIVGQILFGIFGFGYRLLVWKWRWIRHRLGHQYITRLKRRYGSLNLTDDEIIAVWDHAFFEVDGPFTQRILLVSSRAYSWGVIALDLMLALIIWLVFVPTRIFAQTYWFAFLVFSAFFLVLYCA